jgi:leucyl-tRNA synthetase
MANGPTQAKRGLEWGTADEKAKAAIAGKEIVKVIVVPEKLVSIVVR